MKRERDGKGRFIKGNTGNPNGRPKRATEEEYNQAFKDVIPLDRWKRIIEKQAERAEKRGDLIAFKALVAYLVGVPTQKIEQTGKGGGPQEHTVRFVWDDKQQHTDEDAP